MTLPFSTQLNGKPTYFVEKIWKGLPLTELSIEDYEYNWDNSSKHSTHLVDWTKYWSEKPKFHTIREDKNNRWKAGKDIHFYINNRTKNAFQFAPVLPVVSTQEIFMTRRGSMLEISIAKVDSYIGGDDFQLDAFQQGELALNDGFDEYDDFRNYFLEAIKKNGKETGNYWFKGKIIHWTDLRY